jgi:HAD superfamily hydrolase (TIGR01509 family)
MPSSSFGVLYDVDGTLVDTNYLHVVAWWRAFRARDCRVSMTDIHRTVGQGAGRLVESLLGEPDDDVVQGHTDFYAPFLYGAPAFPGAADLLRATKKARLGVVLATSASEKEASMLRRAIDADDFIDALTNSDDVESSKPEPDIVQAALDKADLSAEHALFVGDTVWDVEAARRAGLDCVAVLSGGISEHELREAGAVAVYRDVAALLDGFDTSPLGELARRAADG